MNSSLLIYAVAAIASVGIIGCGSPAEQAREIAFVEELGDEETFLSEVTSVATRGFTSQLETFRVDVGNIDFVTVEIEYIRPFTGKVFIAWHDAKGSSLVEYDNYRLRVWPYEAAAPVPSVRDRYVDIPVPNGAAYLVLSTNFTNDDGNIKALRFFSKKKRRRNIPKDNGEPWNRVQSHGDPGAVLVSGVSFSIPKVKRAWVIGSKHKPRQILDQTVHVGALLPQQVLLEGPTGVIRGIRFFGNEGFRIRRGAARDSWVIEVFAYHFGEHTFRANSLRVDASGMRTNPNLSLYRGNMPPAKNIQIQNSDSEFQFLFPTWQPEGHLAMVAIADHADYTSTETARLVMFGNDEEELRAGDGLLGNGIAVTKSIFALGSVTQFTADVPHPRFHSALIRASTLDVDPRFSPLMRKLHQSGLVEIAPHSSACCGHKDFHMVREALARLAEFNPVTWIDHGGRETLTMYGWDAKTAEYNIAPLLTFNQYRYVWGDTDKYPGQLNMLRDDGASSLLFEVPDLGRRNQEATHFNFFASNQVTWNNELFSEESLQRLVDQRGISIIHSYLGRDAVDYGPPDATGRPQLKLAPFANPSFRRLHSYISKEMIWSTTVGKWADYVERVRAVKVESEGDSAVIENPSETTIKGFTIARVGVSERAGRPRAPTVDQVAVEGYRVVDGIEYYWFDLLPGKHNLSFNKR